jgi:cytochrome c-type biogenesis protein CcmH/NrfF
VLIPTNDPEHTDDELAEGVPTLQLVGMILWLVPALLVLAPIVAIMALFSRPKDLDEFVDPIEAVRVLDGEGTA